MLRAPMRDKRYLGTALGPTVQEYLAWKKLSMAAERTLDTYERDLARLCTQVPHLGIEEIGPPDLMLVLERCPRGSWKRVRTAWSDFFRWAVRFGHRQTNPVEILPRIKPPAAKVYDIFTPGELASLTNAARRQLMPAVEVARLLLLVETGARAGEVRALRVGDVDLARKYVVLKGKGNKERLVPLQGDAILAFEEYLLTPLARVDRLPEPTDYVWFPVKATGPSEASPNRRPQVLWADPTKPMTYAVFWNWWKRIIDEAGIKYRKPHMTRHTYATDVLDATEGDLYAVKELLGHASTKTTEVYIHSSRTRLQSAVERLQKYRSE
jgi:integrase/recombinase XerC